MRSNKQIGVTKNFKNAIFLEFFFWRKFGALGALGALGVLGALGFFDFIRTVRNVGFFFGFFYPDEKKIGLFLRPFF